MTPGSALALVRRTRVRLEGMRLVRSASRGALVATAAAILLLVLDRLASTSVPATWLWALPGLGAVIGTAYALTQHRVEAVSTALFLDARFSTNERFVTLWSNRDSSLAPRWATELGDDRPTPRIVWPREAGLAPVALFVLFVAGLLPAPEADASVVVPVQESKAADNEAAATSEGGSRKSDPEQAAKTLRTRLRTGRALTSKEIAAVREAIQETFARPEDRRRAQSELSAAMSAATTAGSEESAERLALALIKGAGALGDSGGDSGGIANGSASNGASSGDTPGARFASPYRDEMEYLRAYQVELARLREAK